MKRAHALLAASVLGVAAATGTVAVTRTTQHANASAAAPAQLPTAEVVRRGRALDRLERQIQAALRARTPALPKPPRYAPVAVPTEQPPARMIQAGTSPAAPAPVAASTPVVQEAAELPSAPPPSAPPPAAASDAEPAQPAPSVAIVAEKPVIKTRTSPLGGEQGDDSPGDDDGDEADEAYERHDSGSSLASSDSRDDDHDVADFDGEGFDE